MTSSNPNIGLIGFSRETAKVFEATGLNIASHIYANDKQKKKITETDPELINFHHWKSYSFSENYEKPAPLDKMIAAKEKYMNEFIRCTDRWPWSAELVNNWNDYDHLFKLACDITYCWLHKYKIDCLIYSNVPHQGLALAQYAIAQELGIKTLVFTQSSFSGKSWLVENWHDIGIFKTAKSSKAFTIDISEPTAPPFYMASVKSKTTQKIKNSLQRIRARGIITLGLTGLSSKQRRKVFQRNTKRWKISIEDNRYIKQAYEFFTNPSLDEKYVYFPLHLQPEMTTDVLGSKYADQVLALETLREIIPAEIPIYVKENPKQTGKLRSESFFNRLMQIPNIRFIASQVSSFDLIRNAVAVSTITGTAGWEALRMKKPVIVFGSIYWNRFPGAFHISQKPTWDKVESFEYNSGQLQNAANAISQYAHDGICDIDYSSQLSGFDSKTNSENLAKAIKNHMKIE